jgi:hypothetical protein
MYGIYCGWTFGKVGLGYVYKKGNEEMVFLTQADAERFIDGE